MADKRAGRPQIRERAVINDKQGIYPSYTLEESLALFVNVKRSANLKERTVRDYVTNMRYFFDWVAKYIGDITVDEVTLHMLRDYVNWCANDKVYYEGHPYKSEVDKERKGLEATSINVRIRILKSFFNTLFDEEIIPRNPVQKLSLMRQDVDTVQPLSEDDLKRLLDAPDKRYFAQFRDYVIMVLIIDNGMRINEICSLEVKEVDLKAGNIVLPAKKNKNRRPRVLPLSQETVRLLSQLIAESRQYFESDYVFNTNYGSPINEKTIQKALTKYAEKAGITDSVTPHKLRHNFATMASEGMDIFSLQMILGHQDINTTRKYVQRNKEIMMQQHEKFSPIKRVLKRK